ncbi:hypothetical protein C8T65DRAFT_745811 [Cerioporus squamosus]|nr:hypothetical protein C8T65DRAFT_745811 [Cerioporus squamosus]
MSVRVLVKVVVGAAGAWPIELAGAWPIELAGAWPIELAGAWPIELAGAWPIELAGAWPIELAGVVLVKVAGAVKGAAQATVDDNLTLLPPAYHRARIQLALLSVPQAGPVYRPPRTHPNSIPLKDDFQSSLRMAHTTWRLVLKSSILPLAVLMLRNFRLPKTLQRIRARLKLLGIPSCSPRKLWVTKPLHRTTTGVPHLLDVAVDLALFHRSVRRPMVGRLRLAVVMGMLHNANQHILDLTQQLSVANQKLAYYEAQEAVKKKGGKVKTARGNEDDPDQPAALTGMKLQVRSHIRAFALMFSPWPNLRPLEWTYTPDFNPLDPFERYEDANNDEPRVEAQVVQLREFFPEEYLPYMGTEWMRRQFTEVINVFKSHIVGSVKAGKHIIFRHIPKLHENLVYWRGQTDPVTKRDNRYPAIFFPLDRNGDMERLFQNPAVAKACRLMTHGRAASEGDKRIRQNTNSSKWKLKTVTVGMVSASLVLVRYLLSGKSSFERPDWEGAFNEYYRKILETIHKRSMKDLFAWLDHFVFGPGHDLPLELTPEPLPVTTAPDLGADCNREGNTFLATRQHQQVQADADDAYLHQPGPSNYAYAPDNDHALLRSPLPVHDHLPSAPLHTHDHLPAPLHAHSHYANHTTHHATILPGRSYYDEHDDHDEHDKHGQNYGSEGNVSDNGSGVGDIHVFPPVHRDEDIRNDWQLVSDDAAEGSVHSNSGDVGHNHGYDSCHDNLQSPTHHELSYQDLPLLPSVPDRHANDDPPMSRHVHFSPSVREHEPLAMWNPEVAHDNVLTSVPAVSSSSSSSSGVPHPWNGGLAIDGQAAEEEGVANLTVATANLALVQPQPVKRVRPAPRPRGRKGKEVETGETVPVATQISSRTLRARNKGQS